MSQLLDSGFLYALVNKREQRHATVLAAVGAIHGSIYLPTVAVTETAYLVQRDMGSAAVADFLDALIANHFILLEPETDDIRRAATLIRQYADSGVDFVDAMLVALAERLRITRILTIDQRHFRLFRPQHCDAFELIP